jgi:inner membrane transporter RhtA
VTTADPWRATLASRAMRAVPAFVLVLLGITLFQSGAVLATELFDRVGPAAAAMLRLLFAAAMMAAIWHPLPRRLSRPQARAVLAFGLILGTMNLCFYEAIDRIPLGTAVTLQFAGPLAVAVIGRRHALDLLWTAMAAAGIVALVSPGGSGGELVGYLFVAVAAVAWAGYIVGSARLGTVFEDSRGLALGMVAACAVPLAPGLVNLSDADFSLAVIPLAVAVALLSSVLPHTFDNEALRRLPSNVFGVLMSLEPVIASVLGAVFLAQYPSAREGVGILLVVVAAVGVMRGHSAAPEHG